VSVRLSADQLHAYLREVPDFPSPGILFRDITPLLGHADALASSLAVLAEVTTPLRPSKVVGVESRGFLFGVPIAQSLGVGFVPVRKPGKLPAETISASYGLEYGTDTLELHADALSGGDRVVIVDDVLATGGTARAASQLVTRLGATVVGFVFLIELAALGGRTKLDATAPVTSILQF
jgi:adenine phosphoribosyltransferase